MSDRSEDPVPAQGRRGQERMEPQEAFLELGRIALDETPLTQVLQRVAELAKATIPGVDEVSVTLIQGDEARSVTSTGDLAVQLDERQYHRGSPPRREWPPPSPSGCPSRSGRWEA